MHIESPNLDIQTRNHRRSTVGRGRQHERLPRRKAESRGYYKQVRHATARVAKPVNAGDLKSPGLAALRVRNPPRAPEVLHACWLHFCGGWSRCPQALQVRASFEP